MRLFAYVLAATLALQPSALTAQDYYSPDPTVQHQMREYNDMQSGTSPGSSASSSGGVGLGTVIVGGLVLCYLLCDTNTQKQAPASEEDRNDPDEQPLR